MIVSGQSSPVNLAPRRYPPSPARRPGDHDVPPPLRTEAATRAPGRRRRFFHARFDDGELGGAIVGKAIRFFTAGGLHGPRWPRGPSWRGTTDDEAPARQAGPGGAAAGPGAADWPGKQDRVAQPCAGHRNYQRLIGGRGLAEGRGALFLPAIRHGLRWVGWGLWLWLEMRDGRDGGGWVGCSERTMGPGLASNRFHGLI